jgi:epoxide hydrolase 4
VDCREIVPTRNDPHPVVEYGVNLNSKWIVTNGVRLNVVEDGPLVILLHGFPEYWYGWRNQIPALGEAGFHVVAPDQRGYHLSDKPLALSAYRLDVLARDVTGLMDALGAQKAILVGHDWGGLVAWAVAALYPERVEKLAVLNAPYPLAPARTVFRHPEQLLRSVYLYFFQLPYLPEAVLRKNDWELVVEGMRKSSRPGAFTAEDYEFTVEERSGVRDISHLLSTVTGMVKSLSLIIYRGLVRSIL